MESSQIEPRHLFDTDILVDYFRGAERAAEFLDKTFQSATVSVSSMTQMELIVGCTNKKHLKDLKQFLNRFDIIPLDNMISTKTISLLEEYNLSHHLLIADALIAATALVYDIPLATKNQRDFRFIKGLRLVPYPSAKKRNHPNK